MVTIHPPSIYPAKKIAAALASWRKKINTFLGDDSDGDHNDDDGDDDGNGDDDDDDIGWWWCARWR